MIDANTFMTHIEREYQTYINIVVEISSNSIRISVEITNFLQRFHSRVAFQISWDKKTTSEEDKKETESTLKQSQELINKKIQEYFGER